MKSAEAANPKVHDREDASSSSADLAWGTHNTREEWLARAVECCAALFEELGWKVPVNLKVACGFPSTGSLARKRTRIGECWSSANSRSGHFEIFVSPLIDEPIRVLDVLIHEMVHAVVGLKCGHRGRFRRCAIEIGLTGSMTSTVAGEDLEKRLNAVSRMLGPYPHRAITAMHNGRMKQGTRLRKVVCGHCGYTVRVTQTWIDRGLPTCACGKKMDIDYRVAKVAG